MRFGYYHNVSLSLTHTHCRWQSFNKDKSIDYLEKAVYGLADHDIIVMLLPENKVHTHTHTQSILSSMSLC